VFECLTGISELIQIACLFNFETNRDAFIRTLCRWTSLALIREMTPKHVEAIKTIIDISYIEKSKLKRSWKEVLDCCSKLDHLRLTACGAKKDFQFFNLNKAKTNKRPSVYSTATTNTSDPEETE
jgi:brefeldin A-inhibited guanine nucleotide-exchange protein